MAVEVTRTQLNNASDVSGRMLDADGNALTVKYKAANPAAGGTDTVILAAVTGKKIRVLAYAEQCGATIYWMAWKDTANNIKNLTYAGNATDNRSITGAGFQPEFAILRADDNTTSQAVLRATNPAGDLTHIFAGSGDQANIIQAFEADGIQVGTDERSNENLINYYGVVMKDLIPAPVAVTGGGMMMGVG